MTTLSKRLSAQKSAGERARLKGIARKTAESHRHAYIRLTPDQRVDVCVDLEAMSLEWRREAMASRNEIGRLRQLVRDLNKIIGPSDEPVSARTVDNCRGVEMRLCPLTP